MNLLKLPFAAALTACAFSTVPFEAEAAGKGIQRGAASWYGPGFHGRKTANGERFNTHAMTAAHRSLPFGTRVRVVNERTGRSVVVRINDRGPFHGGRIIDLAQAPARALGITGTAYVSLHRDS
ncbi:MAG TPA: septal ring lytic transglycosylase RlpA family protein [Beijerinckiaceae bacterium]|jgi:rare lipoprotein A|nr:septal ring lytic transglycosylase RlpA family protein [Beijerinckiaceae bacterium]